MKIKDTLIEQGMKLLSNPNVVKFMQNERVMKVVMGAMSIPGKVTTFTEKTSETVAKTMSFATSREVRELKRAIRKLEQQVDHIKKQGGS